MRKTTNYAEINNNWQKMRNMPNQITVFKLCPWSTIDYERSECSAYLMWCWLTDYGPYVWNLLGESRDQKFKVPQCQNYYYPTLLSICINTLNRYNSKGVQYEIGKMHTSLKCNYYNIIERYNVLIK